MEPISRVVIFSFFLLIIALAIFMNLYFQNFIFIPLIGDFINCFINYFIITIIIQQFQFKNYPNLLDKYSQLYFLNVAEKEGLDLLLLLLVVLIKINFIILKLLKL